MICCTYVVPKCSYICSVNECVTLSNITMATTLKVVLRKKKNQDGTYPLAIRITKDRKTSYIYIGQHLSESDWDAKGQRVKKSHINSARLNNFILKKLSEANDKVLETASQNKDISSSTIKRAIRPKEGSSFFAQADIYLEQLTQNGKFNRRSADEPRVNRFKEFLGNTDIPFSEITPAMLEKFKAFLNSTREIGERTIVNHFVVIRSIYNQAINAGVADKKNYPFGKGKIIIKFPDSLKIGLTAEEVRGLEDIELTTGEHHARNLWLISFYFAGMRASDVLRLKWSDFHDGRLYYTMGKNLKAGSVKVPEKALRILQQYPQNQAHDLVFPDLTKLKDLNDGNIVQSYIKTRVRSCDDYLKKIAKKLELTKPLSMHISRHSFAQISEDKIPTNILQRLYRHSDIKTTMGYQSHFIHKTTDDALDAVIML